MPNIETNFFEITVLISNISLLKFAFYTLGSWPREAVLQDPQGQDPGDFLASRLMRPGPQGLASKLKITEESWLP